MYEPEDHPNEPYEEREEHPYAGAKPKSRARRREQDDVAIRRQVRILSQYRTLSPAELAEKGRYRKLHAMDCGRPNCVFCTNERRRLPGEKGRTVQERRQFDILRDASRSRARGHGIARKDRPS